MNNDEHDDNHERETLVYESDGDIYSNRAMQQQKEQDSESECEIDYADEEEDNMENNHNENQENNEDDDDNEEELHEFEENENINGNGFVNTGDEEQFEEEADMPPLISIADIMIPVQHFPAVNQGLNYLNSNPSESSTAADDLYYHWTFTYGGRSVNFYSTSETEGLNSSIQTNAIDSNYLDELIQTTMELKNARKLKKCKDLLYFAKSSESFELELLKGTLDSILYEEFLENEDVYILDDCFTNFFKFDALHQLFCESNLNPVNQLPVERILKFKVKLL